MNPLTWLKKAIEYIKQRYRARRCASGRNLWREYTVRSKKFVFYLRECRWCDVLERQNAGPMGDKKWYPINTPLKYHWEQEEFDKAL